jgi:hypothetical protein
MTEPSILGINTYKWKPASSASARRAAETKTLEQVASYFKDIGLKVSVSGNSVSGEAEGISVEFNYQQSCQNVYKSLSVYSNGKKSNITALRKFANRPTTCD